MGKHILVIDDEQSVRDAFELALDASGYEVETAASGADGLSRAAARRPDLVFLDLRMPGMDGVETLRRLQQVAPGLTVYIITAFHQVYLEALKQVQSEGISFQLAKKPLAGADIREITRSVLEGPEASRHE